MGVLLGLTICGAIIWTVVCIIVYKSPDGMRKAFEEYFTNANNNDEDAELTSKAEVSESEEKI